MKEISQFLKFEPILKDKIWGGEKLISLLNKKSEREDIGESWEISDVKGDTSIVSSGSLKGATLKELIATYKSNLVGEKVFKKFGENFPLLIKFIDAKKALSIQLHPNDAMAKERHNSFGKTEMWYVMQADKKSKLIVGFKENSSKEKYLKALREKNLVSILNIEEVTKGDVFFIPDGRIHAIGAGVLLAEIQQTSDITYRVYDWDRPKKDGKYRELHTEEALEAINFSSEESYKTKYKVKQNASSEIISCPYFTTNVITLNKNSTIKVNHNSKDSFVIYMCVKGFCSLISKNSETTINLGETILVPASLKEFQITSSQDTELLEVYIK